MNRRDFLRALGLGAAAVAIEEPIRKMWFVPSNAPVGSRVEPAPTVPFGRHTRVLEEPTVLELLENPDLGSLFQVDLDSYPTWIGPPWDLKRIGSTGITFRTDGTGDPSSWFHSEPISRIRMPARSSILRPISSARSPRWLATSPTSASR